MRRADRHDCERMRQPDSVRGRSCSPSRSLLPASRPARRLAGRPDAPDQLVQQVRVALGHGEVAEARRLADSSTAAAASRDLAVGPRRYLRRQGRGGAHEARAARAAAPLGDAALELGLLELRHGRRDEGSDASTRSRRIARSPARTTTSAWRARREARASSCSPTTRISADWRTWPRADIQTDWGDLFLERHSPATRSTSYTQGARARPGLGAGASRRVARARR